LPDTLLRLERLTKLYPGTIALHDASLELERGEVHGIIGKNGAGKTTLVKIISGIESPTSGTLTVRGTPHAGWTRAEARGHGISIVSQEPQLVPDFTVAENLFTPDYPRGRAGMIDWRRMLREAERVLAEAGIGVSPRARGSDLSLSEQQLVLVARAFFVDRSGIILLDEVTASLSEKDEALLDGLIRGRKAEGRAIIYITHRMAEILRLCDRVSVLRDGRVVATERVSDLDEARLSAYITGAAGAPSDAAPAGRAEAPACAQEAPLLRVESLRVAGRREEVSLELREGEILGLAGLRGCGRTEIMKTLAGIMRPDAGAVLLDGRDARVRDPEEALHRGIVYLPEDRDREGLIETHGVRQNLSLSSLGAILRGPFIDRRGEGKRTAELVSLLSIDTPSAEQEVRYLSGGNKQKVVVGRILSTRPRLYLLDEPTKGIDIAAKRGIVSMIRTVLRTGAGVILTSPGLDDLMEACDRILVLHRGRLTAAFRREEFDESRIYMAMQGLGGKE
jgi:ABC-type sugar transport system ATPase subunit